MADLGMHFNPSDVPEDERGSFEPLPAGDYNVQIIESEMRTTANGGDMLRLTMEVLDGHHSGRRVWDNLNLRNANPDAQAIAQRSLAQICDATGTGPVSDSEDLHFKPLVVALKVRPAGNDKKGVWREAQNAVSRYKARSGQPPAGKAAPQRQAASPVQQARTGTGGGSKPWERGQQTAARSVPLDDDIPF